MKTSDLIGPALDWAVATCELTTIPHFISGAGPSARVIYVPKRTAYKNYSPSTNWKQGGPIIEAQKLDAFWNSEADWWSVSGWDKRAVREVVMRDPHYLTAAMRCYVASRLGDEVDVPTALEN